jgi:hypothetical protein
MGHGNESTLEFWKGPRQSGEPCSLGLWTWACVPRPFCKTLCISLLTCKMDQWPLGTPVVALWHPHERLVFIPLMQMVLGGKRQCQYSCPLTKDIPQCALIGYEKYLQFM